MLGHVKPSLANYSLGLQACRGGLMGVQFFLTEVFCTRRFARLPACDRGHIRSLYQVAPHGHHVAARLYRPPHEPPLVLCPTHRSDTDSEHEKVESNSQRHEEPCFSQRHVCRRGILDGGCREHYRYHL